MNKVSLSEENKTLKEDLEILEIENSKLSVETAGEVDSVSKSKIGTACIST